MEIKFDFNDILIQPAAISYIESRSKINILDENGMLPIFTAPMIDVINEENSSIFNDNGIYSIIPRKNEYDLSKIVTNNPKQFISLGLDDFIKIILEGDLDITPQNKAYILIDIANGHMVKLAKTIKKGKNKYGDNIIIMCGNIANPETFTILSDAGADYIRLGIGNGCFTPDNQVITENGLSKIKDVKIGDIVLTHTGEYKEVINTMSYERNEEIIIINGIECTKNHEFYVVDKKYKDIINDTNYQQYAKWIHAEELDIDNYLLIEL